jgi:hypothetical protein
MLLGSLSSASAAEYLGEYCWYSEKTENENGPTTDVPYLHRVWVTDMSGTYAITSITEIPGHDPRVGTGSAVVVGDKVIVTTSQTYDHHPWHDSGTVQQVLDASTFNGTFWYVRSNFNSQTHTYNPEYGAGTMTFTSCP